MFVGHVLEEGEQTTLQTRKMRQPVPIFRIYNVYTGIRPFMIRIRTKVK